MHQRGQNKTNSVSRGQKNEQNQNHRHRKVSGSTNLTFKFKIYVVILGKNQREELVQFQPIF